MAKKLWLCRGSDLSSWYGIIAGKKPKLPEEGGDWSSHFDYDFCDSMWEDEMPKSLHLAKGAGPVQIELVPRKSGKTCMTAKLDVDVEISELAYVDKKFWNSVAPAELKLKKEDDTVKFALKRVK